MVTAANDYMDADGVTHTYGENAELEAWVHGYFYLEYNLSLIHISTIRLAASRLPAR